MNMKVYACPRCGSKKIFMGTIDSGVLIGVSSTKNVCRNCGFQGSPLLFNSEKQYQQFIDELKKKKTNEKTKKDTSSPKNEELTEKDKLVLDYVKDIKNCTLPDKEPCEKNETKNWWPEIIIALIISIVVGILLYPSLVSIMTEPFTTIYLFGYIFISFMSALVIILIIEYSVKQLNTKIFHLENNRK